MRQSELDLIAFNLELLKQRDHLATGLRQTVAVLSQLQDAMPLTGKAQEVMSQGYTAHAIGTARALLAALEKETL
jgi:hypothetical protein